MQKRIAVTYWSGTGNTEAMAVAGLIIQNAPDEDDLMKCRALGIKLAA